MRLTLIQPSVGRGPGRPYLRTWQMEPLSLAQIRALTPSDVTIRFYDDRLEPIPYDESTDLVALTVETYTAKRAYQIASEYRQRRVPVVMGGFHPTLCSDEVAEFADSLVIGEAEGVWERVIDDYGSGRPERVYRAHTRPARDGIRPDRRLFRGKRYLPIGLVEASRGCRYRCDFCAIGACYRGSLSWRPVEEVADEMWEVGRERKLVFLVDDNLGADPAQGKDLFRALARNPMPWVGQCSIEAAHDPEFLDLMVRSGCQGVLIGLESLDGASLASMNKSFSTARGSYEEALTNLRRFQVRIYGTFVFGYDEDTPESFREALAFARKHRFYMAAFNHLVPFPGTPLYRRLERQGRLRFERWWLDDRYRFNDIAFQPAQMGPEELRQRCIAARRAFYSVSSILERGWGRANRSNLFMWRNFYVINALQRLEVVRRNRYPLGDTQWKGKLRPARPAGTPRPETPRIALGSS